MAILTIRNALNQALREEILRDETVFKLFNWSDMNQLYSFRETKSFTKNVLSLLSEENYYAFQNYLQRIF